jgi:hypothetical protein
MILCFVYIKSGTPSKERDVLESLTEKKTFWCYSMIIYMSRPKETRDNVIKRIRTSRLDCTNHKWLSIWKPQHVTKKIDTLDSHIQAKHKTADRYFTNSHIKGLRLWCASASPLPLNLSLHGQFFLLVEPHIQAMYISV